LSDRIADFMHYVRDGRQWTVVADVQTRDGGWKRSFPRLDPGATKTELFARLVEVCLANRPSVGEVLFVQVRSYSPEDEVTSYDTLVVYWCSYEPFQLL